MSLPPAPGSGFAFALQEPALSLVVIFFYAWVDSSPSGPTGGAKDSLHRAEVRALRAGDRALPPTTQWGSGEPLEPDYREYMIT